MIRIQHPTARYLAAVVAVLFLCLLVQPAHAAEGQATPAVVVRAPAAPLAWSMPDPRLIIGNRTRMIQFVAIGMCIALWIMFRNK